MADTSKWGMIDIISRQEQPATKGIETVGQERHLKGFWRQGGEANSSRQGSSFLFVCLIWFGFVSADNRQHFCCLVGFVGFVSADSRQQTADSSFVCWFGFVGFVSADSRQ
jgi:hypothetical protein